MEDVLKELLHRAINQINAGSCNLSDEAMMETIEFLQAMVNPEDILSKYQAAEYLKVSKSTFNNYIKEGKVPPGKKIPGMSSLIWYKKDLNKLINNGK